MPKSDFDQIVDSYMPAAEELRLDREDVESAVFNARRFDHCCESCRFSRAPHMAARIASLRGCLPIYSKSCTKGPVYRRCKAWELLDTPDRVLQEHADELEVSHA